MEDASDVAVLPEAVDAPLGLRTVDWLKRRMKELLRVGRVSVAVAPVNVCMLDVAALVLVLVLVLAGMELLKLPGAGKSLRSGSYARLFAKSSKLTEGRKSYDEDVCVGSTGSFGGSGCLEKLNRGFDGPERVLPSFIEVGRKERPSVAGTLGVNPLLATLHTDVSPAYRFHSIVPSCK